MTTTQHSRRELLAALLAIGAGCATDSGNGSERSRPYSRTITGESNATAKQSTPVTTAPEPAEIRTDVVFRETAERTLKLDLYLPSSDDPSPFVLFSHGGYWTSGGRIHRPMYDRLVNQGIAVADVQYRLSRVAHYPAAVRDVVAAIKWVRANAGEYDIDADRAALMGVSAGAHLSALIATAPDHENFQPPEFHPDVSVSVDAVVAHSGPYDLTRETAKDDWAVKRFFGEDVPIERLKEGSPVTHVDSDDPPALLVHGTEDEIVPYRSATVLAEAYREAGATVEVLTGDGAGHDMLIDDEYRDEMLPTQEQFLADHLQTQ